jgi:hypothetical protein
MSADKEKLSQLLNKVEELTGQLSKIQEELRSVSASLKSLAVGQITQPATSNPMPPAHRQEKRARWMTSACPSPKNLKPASALRTRANMW